MITGPRSDELFKKVGKKNLNFVWTNSDGKVKKHTHNTWSFLVRSLLPYLEPLGTGVFGNKCPCCVPGKVCIWLTPTVKLSFIYKIALSHIVTHLLRQIKPRLVCANIQQINSKKYSRNNYVQVELQVVTIIHKLYKFSPFKYTSEGSLEKFCVDSLF